MNNPIESEDSLEPAVYIFHCGRCGSTLLARLFEADPANRVCIEPDALRKFFQVNGHNLDHPGTRRILQTLVRSHGLKPSPGQDRLVLKFHSMAVLFLGGIRACFPEVNFIYVLRDPTEVVASLIGWTPNFLADDNRSKLAATLGGATRNPDEYSRTEWLAWYVDRNLRLAWENRNGFAEVIDYRDYMNRFLLAVNRFSGTAFSVREPAILQTLSVHARNPMERFSRIRDAGKVASGVEQSVLPIAGESYERWRQYLGKRDIAS